MFGVVPKQLWQKTNPADELNLCTWAMRCLLVEDGDRLTLIDTGIGSKQSEKFFSHYHLQDTLTIDQSLALKGFHRNDITDVLLTHLHFDHCGGSIEYNSTREHFQPAFPNAKFWSNKNHWKWATEPNPREKASFLSDNILPIQESGQLNFIERVNNVSPTPLGFDVLFVFCTATPTYVTSTIFSVWCFSPFLRCVLFVWFSFSFFCDVFCLCVFSLCLKHVFKFHLPY